MDWRIVVNYHVLLVWINISKLMSFNLLQIVLMWNYCWRCCILEGLKESHFYKEIWGLLSLIVKPYCSTKTIYQKFFVCVDKVLQLWEYVLHVHVLYTNFILIFLFSALWCRCWGRSGRSKAVWTISHNHWYPW